MTEMLVTDRGVAYSQEVAAEVRAMLARRQVQGKRVAQHLGVSAMYVSRRLHGDLPWDVGDLARIADLVGCSVADLMPAVTHGYRPTAGDVGPPLYVLAA